MFDTVAGRYIALCFFGSAANSASRAVLDAVVQHRHSFDDENISFFGISVDPDDERTGRIQEALPGVHLFWDFDRQISRRYGAIVEEPTNSSGVDGASAADASVSRPTADTTPLTFRLFTMILDERLRVVASLPFGDRPEEHIPQVLQFIGTLPTIAPDVAAGVPAPILIVPRIFEEELCRKLVSYYETSGGKDSGFMRDVNGQTVFVSDHRFKRREDCEITDEQMRQECMVRISERLLPEIYKAFQFQVTRLERYLVACYEAEKEGHFGPHRDNTTKGTAHRRFAVSLVLNAEEFEGGTLRFPEFGRQTYSPPTGGAIVFSCSLLHEATPVTKGRRYVFLPFLYDEAAAQIRAQNLAFIQTPTPSLGLVDPDR
jgi:predicted 2-oxoglutarate/Fe(II)-dependent dioxygenase YbiX